MPQMAHPSLALGVLGMPAFTAYVGLLDIGQPRPGETVVVAAATGAVGAVVGQIAKLKGARAVGIAGGPEKCRHAVEELGFDVCLDRRDPELAARLATACPEGIDVYFENVGGVVFDAVLPLLNIGARVPVIGLIAHYNDRTLPLRPDPVPALMTAVLQKRIRMQGLIILDHYADRFDAFRGDMSEWVRNGRVKLREDGLDDAECDLLETCRSARFIEELRRFDLSLSVALDSPSLSQNGPFRAAIEAASLREGSDCLALSVPGLRWWDDGSAFVVEIPGGAGARIKRRLDARLPFGEPLLVHALDEGAGTEVRFVPGPALDIPEANATRIVVTMPPASPHIQLLGNDATSWPLRYA